MILSYRILLSRIPLLVNHPQVALLSQQQQVTKCETALERSKLLPDLELKVIIIKALLGHKP